VIESGVDDILLTWQAALRAFEDSSDGQLRDELIEQIRRLEGLYRRKSDGGLLGPEQRARGHVLLDETKRLLGSSDNARPDEPGEWY
jgi:hypothetical protein